MGSPVDWNAVAVQQYGLSNKKPIATTNQQQQVVQKGVTTPSFAGSAPYDTCEFSQQAAKQAKESGGSGFGWTAAIVTTLGLAAIGYGIKKGKINLNAFRKGGKFEKFGNHFREGGKFAKIGEWYGAAKKWVSNLFKSGNKNISVKGNIPETPSFSQKVNVPTTPSTIKSIKPEALPKSPVITQKGTDAASKYTYTPEVITIGGNASSAPSLSVKPTPIEVGNNITIPQGAIEAGSKITIPAAPIDAGPTISV